MKNVIVSLVAAVALAAAVTPIQAALIYNPVVTILGDGTNTASGIGTTTTIAIYNASTASQVAPVDSIAFNSGSTGTRLVNSYTASSEGALTNNPSVSDNAAKGLSYTGPAYTYSAGYDAADGTASVINAANNANRAIGQVTLTGNTAGNAIILQTQTQATAYNANNFRGATGNDTGTALYSAGTGSTSTTAGWRNFNTNTILSATPTNTRTVELLGGYLFGSTGSGTTGIYVIDPTGATAAVPVITGTGLSPYEFAFFTDPNNTNTAYGYNVAYIADDSAANGGIEKWTFNGTAWAQAYILRDTATTFYHGLAGELDADTGLVTLFASTSDGTKLQQVTDTGAGASFTTLATLSASTDKKVFRGVALTTVPEPTTLGLLGFAGMALLARRSRRV